MVSPGTPPQVNLNPAQASPPSLARQPMLLSALKSEATRGTEQTSFRIPSKLKSLVSVLISEPGSQFQGAISNFYLLAVGRLLQDMAPWHRHDQEYTNTVRALEALSRTLEYEEPCADFRRRLEKAEQTADICVQVENWTLGLAILSGAVNAVLYAPDGLRISFEVDLRSSKSMRALMAALVADEAYGLSSEVDRLQKFMGGSL